MPRYAMCVLLLLAAGCRSPAGPSICVVDFIEEFDRAEMRPPAAFHLADPGRPSILAPAPGRISWTLPLPRRGRFDAYVTADGAVPVRFRVGVSDDRIYERLAEAVIEPARGWTRISADLSAYAGRKWSLFYRPDTTAWHLTLSTDAIAGTPGRGMWGTPLVLTDRAAASEYAKRRQRLAHGQVHQRSAS